MYVAKESVMVNGGREVSLVRTDVTPNAGYLQRCRAVASTQGEAFRAAYEDTTYLADRITTLRESGI